MHIPDGFIDVPVSAAAGIAAAGTIAVVARKAARDLDDRAVPLAALVTVYVFAVQMLNFPVAAGTSGHLLGAVLAAVLVGPWVAALCLTIVLAVQAFVFADGGITALGLNIVNMAVIGVAVGWGAFALLRRVLPATRGSVVAASAVAAAVSVVAASGGFVLEWALGGTADISIGAVATAMLGTHVLIGIGEAVITGLTVGAVLAARPDLVHGARGMRAVVPARGFATAQGGLR